MGRLIAFSIALLPCRLARAPESTLANTVDPLHAEKKSFFHLKAFAITPVEYLLGSPSKCLQVPEMVKTVKAQVLILVICEDKR